MKNVYFFLTLIIFLIIVFFSQLKLIYHPVNDNDEGIYLTTFHLIDEGHPPYKETFLSQPPGFLLSIYPGFLLFGKTLTGARLTIGWWSLIGLLAIIWLTFELNCLEVGLWTISLLYLIPYYSSQTLTLQSDIPVGVFSLLSLVSLIRFAKSAKSSLLVVSIFFLNLAFWTKFDISLIPSFIFILFLVYKTRRSFSFSKLLLVPLISTLFFLIFILPFGINQIIRNVIWLRLQAVSHYQPSFLPLFDYTSKDFVLFVVILGGIILPIIKRGRFYHFSTAILIWCLTTLVLFIFYRPLFPHHLAILAVPFTLFFSYSGYLLVKSKKKSLSILITLVLLTAALTNRIYTTFKTPSLIVNQDQQNAINIIKKYTKNDDMIVSDEAILTGISGRLPPPELADISQVRIASDNLSSKKIQSLILINKPKLIIAWNGRLQSVKNFNQIIKNYRKLLTIACSRTIYIRN